MKTVIYLFAALLLLSCGARKTNKQETTLDVKQQSTVSGSTAVLTATQLEQTETCEAETETFTPNDNSKPMLFVGPKGDTTKVYNGTYTKTKGQKKTQTKAAEQKQEQHDFKADTGTEIKATDKVKQTEKKEWYGWVFWLIIIAAIIIKTLYENYKAKTA